jgi:hypothetical protein
MNDTIAGVASGAIQTVIGHPFDSMKVWKQQRIKYDVRHVFRGLSFPLASNSIITGIQFATYSYMYSHTNNAAVGGAFSGLFTGLLTAPIDKHKLCIQFGRPTYLGIGACLLREIPSGAIYFGSYGALREREVPIVVSGAIAGVASWLFTYPMDVYKTNVQTGIHTKQIFITRGLGVCLTRAFLVNGIGFYVYEQIKNEL